MPTVITYQIHLLEPMLATGLEGEPNSDVSLNYLPGSVLRGMLIQQYLTNKSQSFSEEQFQRLFFRGDNRFLSGYLMDKLGNRTLPIPLSWRQEKEATRTSEAAYIFDFAVEDPDKDSIWSKAGGQFWSSPSLADDNVTIYSHTPEKQIAVHTQRERKAGRSRKGDGSLYQYESLTAGQTFSAAILCENSEDASVLEALLPHSAYLGGSRYAGYGRVQILNKSTPTSWREVPQKLDGLDEENKLTITLLSDTLIRNCYGQWTLDPDYITPLIQKYLPNISIELHEVFKSEMILGGFNRKWGLPLPQAQAFQKGTVLVFNLSQPVDLKVLEKLEWLGIGERRVDGFGRVAVNLHRFNKLQPPDKSSSEEQATESEGHATEKLGEEDPESKILAEKMITRQRDKVVEAHILQRGHELGLHIKRPHKSQLSRLRLVIQNALLSIKSDTLESSRSRLTTYLTKLAQRKATKEQFERDRVDGKPLLEWLKVQIESQNTNFITQISQMKFMKIGSLTAPSLKPEEIYKYHLLLIDATLAAAGKRKGEK